MTKKLWIQIFIIPNLRSLAEWLRTKDANDTGADDEVAEAADFFIARLGKYLSTGE
jgi:hypothetical protein